MSEQFHGWINEPKKVEKIMGQLPFPVFGDVWESIKDSGKGKVVLLYEIIRKVAKEYPYRRQTIGDCQPKDSLVVGPDFIKKIQDVKVGDRVYCGNGEITTVISTLCKKSNNPILTIHTKGGLPLKVTSDHKVLAYRFGEFINGNSKWKRRYSIGAQRRAIKARGQNTNLKANTIFEARKAELIKASDLKETDYLLCPLNIELDKKIPDEMLPYMGSEESRWMIGLFLGDGHAKKTSKILEWGCTTDCPEIEEKLCKSLDSLDIKWKSYFHCKKISQKAKKVYTEKIEYVYNLFRKYFYDKDGYKILPNWAINDDVIQGLLDADGYKSHSSGKQYQNFENTSISLVHGIRIWCLLNGYTPSLNERQRTDKRNGSVNKKSYKISWSIDKTSRNLWRDEQYLAMPITKIDIQEGPHDEVYDIGVEHRLHTFLSGAGCSISNCVSHGAAYAVDAVKAVDIYLKNDFEEWIAETATEDIYAGSRVQIGGGEISGDGSVGAWAADYVSKYGALPRQKYGDIDLSVYSGDKARSWGRSRAGVPKELLEIAKQHPIQIVSRVDTYEQVRDLIANGYAVTIASDQGFSSRRDDEGFARPQGSWSHQMSILGVDDAYKRPGVLVQNSWGKDWIDGPKRNNQPEGSFWVDADEIERRILSQGDSWAFSGYEGFKPRKLNTRII